MEKNFMNPCIAGVLFFYNLPTSKTDIYMTNKFTKIFTLAFATTLLFACSTSKKYSNRSFGGGWAEPQIAKTSESSTPNQAVEATPAQEATAPAVATVTPNPVASEAAVNSAAGNNQIAVAPAATKSVKAEGMVKKAAQKMLKKQLRKATSKPMDDGQLLYIIIAFFIPFLGVALYEGEITGHFWISLLLTLLFWLPGFIYALLIILGN